MSLGTYRDTQDPSFADAMSIPRPIPWFPRSAVALLVTCVTFACGGAAPVARPESTSSPAAPTVRSVTMTVRDRPHEEAFLAHLDGAFAEPRLALVAAPGGRPFPEPTRSNDLWFQHVAIVVSDIDAAYAQLRDVPGVRAVSPAPQTIPASNPVAAGVRALYFRDPEGHALELLSFPPGKGDPRWHDPSRKGVFLGIDHTAIVSRDTARSLGFYRDVLGLTVTSESLNEGAEQEALSGVPGARVRITSLHGEGGIGIELLDYVAPQDGRPFPETTPADLVHWETTVEVGDLAGIARQLGLTPAGGEVQARDPDGHTVRIVPHQERR